MDGAARASTTRRVLRCNAGEYLEEHPDHRLRLTLGLRREQGAWTVVHEHHSFPDRTPPT